MTESPAGSQGSIGVRLIDRQEELDRFLDRIAAEPLIAVDTEAASFHRYRDRVYLLQVSSRTDTAWRRDSERMFSGSSAGAGVSVMFGLRYSSQPSRGARPSQERPSFGDRTPMPAG